MNLNVYVTRCCCWCSATVTISSSPSNIDEDGHSLGGRYIIALLPGFMWRAGAGGWRLLAWWLTSDVTSCGHVASRLPDSYAFAG